MSEIKTDKLIIVIGRQFGSGGRKLGKQLAEHYSLPYYDKEILSKAAEKFGFSPEIFAKYDEKRPSLLRSLISNTVGIQEIYSSHPLSSEGIYTAQSHVIRELADAEGGVFVGRSADYILRDYPRLISIFLHSPLEKRAETLVGRGDSENLDKAKELAEKMDTKRENFYNYFTGRRWGHADNYHFCMDSSLLDDESTFEVIKDFIDRRLDKSRL